MTIQLPPPTALPAPQLHAAVATTLNAADTPTAETALQAAKALIGAVLRQVRIEEDPDWRPTYIITLDARASEALRINLELQKTLPGVPVVVEWQDPPTSATTSS